MPREASEPAVLDLAVELSRVELSRVELSPFALSVLDLAVTFVDLADRSAAAVRVGGAAALAVRQAHGALQGVIGAVGVGQTLDALATQRAARLIIVPGALIVTLALDAHVERAAEQRAGALGRAAGAGRHAVARQRVAHLTRGASVRAHTGLTGASAEHAGRRWLR